MCGRFTVGGSAEIAEAFELETYPFFRPRYNVAPSQVIAVVGLKGDGRTRLALLRWGLIPPWSHTAKPKHAPINARAETLADRLAVAGIGRELAEEVGALVARFHREGVWHADLNAHNVLIAPGGLYLIDFDRGRLRDVAEGWRLANLQRLRRSMLKLGAAEAGEDAFEREVWPAVMRGYERTFSA